MANETVTIDRKIIVDMARMIGEIQSKIESLELMSDSKTMEAHKKAKEQIKNRDFADWNEL